MIIFRKCTRCKQIKEIVWSFEIPATGEDFDLCQECHDKIMERLKKDGESK